MPKPVDEGVLRALTTVVAVSASASSSHSSKGVAAGVARSNSSSGTEHDAAHTRPKEVGAVGDGEGPAVTKSCRGSKARKGQVLVKYNTKQDKEELYLTKGPKGSHQGGTRAQGLNNVARNRRNGPYQAAEHCPPHTTSGGRGRHETPRLKRANHTVEQRETQLPSG